MGEGGGFRAEGDTAEQGYTHYWSTAAHIVCPTRGSKLAGGPVLIYMGFFFSLGHQPD